MGASGCDDQAIRGASMKGKRQPVQGDGGFDVEGAISTTAAAAASRIQTSNGRSKASRPFACSICASQRLTATKRSEARDASRSSALCSR